MLGSVRDAMLKEPKQRVGDLVVVAMVVLRRDLHERQREHALAHGQLRLPDFRVGLGERGRHPGGVQALHHGAERRDQSSLSPLGPQRPCRVPSELDRPPVRRQNQVDVVQARLAERLDGVSVIGGTPSLSVRSQTRLPSAAPVSPIATGVPWCVKKC
ncbi:hypothetical protein D3C72_2001440 [compost metagenome]